MSQEASAELWEGFQNESALHLAELDVGRVVALQTDAHTQIPRTTFEIEDAGMQPRVVIEEEDGLEIGPPSVKLAGTCTREAWVGRLSTWPRYTSTGLIVPGEHLILEVNHRPRYLKASVVGWCLLDIVERSSQSRGKRR
ncbi:MAG TPA: hypothetical protein VLE74_03915 [Candidatus Saccharimonadales bacterium]|nr:hypothetical protein [Candidatus Saccharimonadales bacterium]